jgi:hypothetical protein
MHSMRHVVPLLLVAALSLGGAASASAAPEPGGAFAAQDPCFGTQGLTSPQCDSDKDGIQNGQDLCPVTQPQAGGKSGCPPYNWYGSEGNSRGGNNLGKTVDNGYIFIRSFCDPDACKSTVTLTAPKAARKALGLKKALIGRQTKSQKGSIGKGGGYGLAGGSFEFDLPRKVVRKLDDLDRIKLKATFEVSAPETGRMKALKFTESGTILFDRRRNGEMRPTPPKGQGLNLFRGTKRPVFQFQGGD